MRSANKSLTENGRYFGYPECCIRSFIRGPILACNRNPVQLEASNHTGFIPCVKHSKQIVSGKITLKDLILPSRMEPKAFPEQ